MPEVTYTLTCGLRDTMPHQRSLHTHMWLTGCHATPEITHTLTYDLRDSMPHQRSLTHSHVTYGMPYHARGHSHTYMWLTGRHAMPEVTHTLTCDLLDAMPCQRSITHLHVTYGMQCCARGHSRTYMWLMGCHAMPEVTHTLTCDLRDVMPHQRSLKHSHQVLSTPASHPSFPPQLPTPAFNVIPHPSVSYHQVFKPILCFQPSSSQGDSRLCPNPYLGKQRICLGVAIILSICLCSHT